MSRKVSTPRTMAAACFKISPGFTVAMAAIPKVQRKKARVSTSKELLWITA